ncbi:potassium channel family protein [Nocardia salmonicida]|uniref:potassium channel family protein n=1 Tax=Nocardia salmonicida TaxID=53431 RepID=UPI0009ED719B|nr:potassium channel family protein [Nocardia salmonicida]
MTRDRRFPHHVMRNGAAAFCSVLLYYSVPVGWAFELDAWPGRLLGVCLFVAGLAGIGWLVWRRIDNYLRAPTAMGAQVDGLLLLVCVVGVVFALFYFRLQQLHPDQFDGLETRTDALYYTLATLGTVGYGDVHAAGQAARIATMVQIVFDLVVLGTLLTIITTSVTGRVQAATRAAREARDVSGGATDTTR